MFTKRNVTTSMAAVFVGAMLLLSASSKMSYADSINNNANAIHLQKGGVPISVGYSVKATGSDGCDVSNQNPVTITLTGVPAGVNFSPSTLTFTACDQEQNFTFEATPDAVGQSQPYFVKVSIVSGPQIDNLSPGNLNVFVAPDVTSGPTPIVDTTAPTVTGTADRAPNSNGWYNATVTITWTADEPATCDAPTVYSGPDGTGITLTGQCTDLSGNVGTGSVVINYDSTAPTITHTMSPESPNANGWYNQNVTVTFTATDGTSGINGDSISTTDLGEGASQSASATFTDQAGNSASDEVTEINVDKTAPSVTTTRTPQPNSNGWNNGDVTVTFDASDGLSGLDGDATYTGTVSTEGSGQSVTHTFTDLAGNTFTATESNINIDKTAPTVTHSLNPSAPNANGWYNQDVVVTFTGSDDLSGIDGSNTQSTTLSENAAGQSTSATFTDLAGNSASDSVSGINIDKVAPTITQLFTNVVMHQPVGNNYASCFDSLSGMASCLVSAFTVNSGVGTTVNSPTVVATDNADNVSTNTATFNVVGYGCVDGSSSGFKSPVPNTQYKLGRDVPLKFVACDLQGNPVNGVVATAWYKLSTATSFTKAVSGSSATTDNLFRYDPSAGQYIFNMSTTGLQVNKPYTVQAQLDSGQTITSTVTFTK